MNVESTKAALEVVSEYFSADSLGLPLVINTENYRDFKFLCERMELDPATHFTYASEYCQTDKEPNLKKAFRSAANRTGQNALVGISHALLFCDEQNIYMLLQTFVNAATKGYLVILLCQCAKHLRTLLANDLRLEKRIILVSGAVDSLPTLEIARDEAECYLKREKIIHGLDGFLKEFEKAETSDFSNSLVITKQDPDRFRKAMLVVRPLGTAYDALCERFPLLADFTAEDSGTESQWVALQSACQFNDNLQTVLEESSPDGESIDSQIANGIAAKDEDSLWYLWLFIKLYVHKDDDYVSCVVQRMRCVQDFEKALYDGLLDWNTTDQNFKAFYNQRRELLSQLKSDNVELDAFAQNYCEKAVDKGRLEVYYLCDLTEKERFEFILCLSNYDYEVAELEMIVGGFSDDLKAYLQRFVFDGSSAGATCKSKDCDAPLTDYFYRYKCQKVTNHIDPDFHKLVDRLARERPYNDLPSRASFLKNINFEDSVCYFFDALGVEYLAYIAEKCEHYGLLCKIDVARCELPSITECNKDFSQYCPGEIKKIDDLDKLIHGESKFNYEPVNAPYYIYDELQIIDTAIQNFSANLNTGSVSKIIVLSDHGASRLAVINECEYPTDKIQLEEKGEHSGRCCPCNENPNLDGAAFVNGYAVLANYDRFKGSRKAFLEVHGGATLEETIVPILTFTLPETEQNLRFEHSIIELHQNENLQLTLIASVPLREPRIRINDEFYDGAVQNDDRRSTFELPNIKRSGKYEADVYDGATSQNCTLSFKVQRATGYEVDLLG